MHTNYAEPTVLDTKGAARHLGVSTSLLEKLRMEPDTSPRFLKIGRKVLYKVADLETWAAARAHGGGQ